MRRRCIALLSEPAVQFLFLGVLIYLAVYLRGQAAADRSRTIIIDAAVTKHLVDLFEIRYGFLPDRRTLDELINNHITDEVLYREAMKLGLAEDDEIIRRRLVEKMRFLIQDDAGIGVPGDTVLKEYFNAHRNQFRDPVRLSFSHIYFSPEVGGMGNAAVRAAQALMNHVRTPGSGLPEGGDPFPLQDDYLDMERDDVVRVFGESPLASALFGVEAGVWSGPYLSGLGWHLVLVRERTGAEEPDFQRHRDRVIATYIQDAAERRNRERLAALLAEYAILRETGD